MNIFRGAVLATLSIVALNMATTTSGYANPYIEWAPTLSHFSTEVLRVKTSGGTELHDWQGAATPATITPSATGNGGLTSFSLTEVSACCATIAGGEVNNWVVADVFSREFTIRMSDPTDLLIAPITMDVSLKGLLTAIPHGSDVYASYAASTGVFAVGGGGTGLGGSLYDFTSSRFADTVNVDRSFTQTSLLAVNVPYRLDVSLQTGAYAMWDGTTASTARADFLHTGGPSRGLTAFLSVPEPSTSLLFAISLLGLLAYGWEQRKETLAS